MTGEPALEPFSTALDLASGELTPRRRLSERTLADMRGMYVAEIEEAREAEVVYRVDEIPVPESNDNLASSTTVIEPGRVARGVLHDQGALPRQPRPRRDLHRNRRGRVSRDGDRGRCARASNG